MKCTETAVPLRFQSPRGEIKLTQERTIHDLEAIDYFTGKEVPLAGVVSLPPTAIYNLTFSDGRRGLYRSDGEIYLGRRIITISDVINIVAELNPGPSKDFYRHLSDGERIVILTENPHLRLDMNGVIRYSSSEYIDRPDPYSAGCLLPVGDFAREYVNMPSNRTDTLDVLSINNNWEPVTGDNIDTIGFKYRGDADKNRVSWKSFMRSNYREDLIGPGISELVSPSYLISPVSDRLEFLRGFFDTNYEMNTEGGLKEVEMEIEISLPFYERIKFIRDIMFSLGIGSQLTSIRSGRDKSKYGLQPKCSLRDFSRLFNKVEKAERLLAASELEHASDRPGAIYLRSIELVRPASPSLNIITPNHDKLVYLGTNFLPRVSYSGSCIL